MEGSLGETESAKSGLDSTRLTLWFTDHIAPVARLNSRLIAGGKSNLTYELDDGRHRWILRRPPLGHVLATAHDMVREHRVLSALHDTAVPVPQTFALCEDLSVVGAPFFVMELVDGTPYRRAEELVALGTIRTRALADRLVDGLVALHSIDPSTVGLADFGRPEGFLARQVRRWRQQLDASYTRELPAADELHRRLLARVEEVESREPASSIVHGDYRLDNLLAAYDGESDRVTAVLDWEMATLGSRLTDLAMLLTYQRAAETVVDGTISDVSRAPGWPTEHELVERYAGGSGTDLADIDFYLGLAGLKLAAIIEGIHFRYLSGQTLGEGFATTGNNIHVVLDVALAALAP